MRKAILLSMAFCCFAGAALAANFNLVPNRLAGAMPGEWVLLANVEETGDRVKVSVVGRECEGREKIIVVKREHMDADGNVTETKEHRVNLTRYQDRLDRLDERANRISREKMTIDERTITVYVVEWEDTENDREMKLWLSYDIPVGGVVRIWNSDPEFPTYELVEYGTE